MVANVLAVLTFTARDCNQIQGFVPYFVDDGLSVLQHADDTIIFLVDDIEQAKNLNLIRAVGGCGHGSRCAGLPSPPPLIPSSAARE